MADVEKILEQLSQLTILEVSDLSKKLEKKWGVDVSAMVAPVATIATGGEEKSEEKIAFDVFLTDAGSQKISVIKEVRVATELGLKEAKDLVESAPGIIKTGISKEDAEILKKSLEAVGAKIELK